MNVLLALLLCNIYCNFSGASIITKRETADINDSTEICQTPGCVKAAKELIKSMDESVNPCEDFYKFACGGFVNKRTIPENKPRISTFDDVSELLNQQLKGLLDAKLDGSEPKFIKMAKYMYDSCLNTDAIEKAGSETLKNILSSFGGWPVVEGDSWDSSKFNWMDTVFKLRNLGFDPRLFIDLGIVLDPKDTTRYIISIDHGVTGDPGRECLMKGFSDPTTKAYFNIMVKAAEMLGADNENAKKEVKNAINFQIKLAELVPSDEKQNSDSSYNKYTVRQLQQFAPQIDWLKYFSGLFMHEIRETETILVISPSYMKQFASFITTADDRAIANFIIWKLVHTLMPLLSKEWRDLEKYYNKIASGLTEESSPVDDCIETVSGKLMVALNAYYLKHYFDADAKEKAEEIVKYIQREFINDLENVDWMKESTKEIAIEKLKLMGKYVGYVPELLNDALILDYYKNLNITQDSYFNNMLSYGKWDLDRYYAKLRTVNVKGDWKAHADVAVVNAFYSLEENSIEIPAGILQGMFFSKDRPHYINFATIGFVIGHELTHGFDDQGRQYDKNGNIKNWWDKTTDSRYKEKAQCIINQYNEYTAENGMKLRGYNTLGENIADNGGLKESYLAYNTWVKDNGPEPKLPDLKYSPGQLFFISAANVYCAKSKPEYLKKYIEGNAHSPFEFRVRGAMSNFDGFAKEFQCPLGSSMNPENKCRVW